MSYFRQPRYFTEFQCMGGTCPNSCCIGWRIDWTKEEIDKVKDDPRCSPELKELCEKSFVYNEQAKKYIVVLDKRQRCPFLTEDNFCKIQRELGAEYLSDTCSTYPRHHIIADACAYRYCDNSCAVVMNKLLNNEKSMDLINTPVKQSVQIKGAAKNNDELLEKHPEVKYRGELLEFFYDIISDKKLSVEDNIILGALAAQSLTKLVERKDYDHIPEALKTLRAQTHSGADLKNIANIKPNYNIKLGILGELLGTVFEIATMRGLVDKEGRYNIDLYVLGEQRLAETFKDRPFYLRNIALNLIFEFVLPFKFTDMTIFENYTIFAAAFALFKLNTIATAELTRRAENNHSVQVTGSTINVNIQTRYDTEHYVNSSAAIISRYLCHNEDKAKMLLEFLKSKNMTSAAYLALLVK